MEAQEKYKTADLIYDWNKANTFNFLKINRAIHLSDETFRDGLQSPSVKDPSIEQKLEMLHLTAKLGIQAADLGLPGSGERAREDITILAKEILDKKLAISPYCAVRTHHVDIEALIDVSQKVGMPIEAAAFIGSSPIRQFAEGWNIEDIISKSLAAVKLAVDNNIPVMYVTEDTTRARPEDIRSLYTSAIEAGAKRICVCDTCGHITPQGVWSLLEFIFEVVKETGEDIRIDWHGHNDRGLGVANSLAAIYAGVDRVHGTILGIGERVGNASIDQILVNLKLDGIIDNDLTALSEYCELVSRSCDVPIEHRYPVMGADAFRTATGVHAAAIIKAEKRGHNWLADRVYSGVSAGDFGKEQIIEIGFMSGMSNVIYWLAKRNIGETEQDRKRIAERVLEKAKSSQRIMTDQEVMKIVSECQTESVG